MKPTAAAVAAAALAAVVAALLAGCGTSPPLRYHALQALPPVRAAAAGAADAAPPLAVGAVQVPPALDRAEVLREVAAGRYEVLDADLWAAPLARLARQALAENLAARLPSGGVVFPGAAAPPAAATLTVVIVSFRVADGTATMLLSWDLRPAAATGARRGAQLQLQTPADGDGAAAVARAFSVLLAQLADRIAAQLSG